MTRRWFVVAVLAVLLLLVVPVSADWLSGWQYRKSHVINNTGGALSDYQVNFTIHRSDGSDSGDDVYIGASGCEEDYDDIRFTKSDGSTLLDYWIEESDSSDATIWVEVDTIAASGDTTIYLYYGNAGASAYSNGDDTFDFFDDFDGSSVDTDKWTKVGSGATYTVSGGALRYYYYNSVGSGSGSRDEYLEGSSFAPGHAIRISRKEAAISQGRAPSACILGRYDGSYPDVVGMVTYSSSTTTIIHVVSSSSTRSISGAIASSTSYRVFDISYTSSESKMYIDGSLESTLNTNVPSTTLPLRVGTTYAGAGTTFDTYIDWILVRKYTATEPTHGAWGSEESVYPITAAFSGVPTSGIVPLTVYFTDNSSSTGYETVTIDTWSWDFGDESPASTDQNPAHQYTTSGTYTVALTASNATYGTTDTETKTDYITVNIDTAAPTADFVATPLCEDINESIYFIDFSTGGGLYAWNWSFGDGNYSELRNPTHTYASNGTYDISLTVWGANGTDTLTKTGYITIPCGAPTPTPTVTGTTPTVTPTSSVTPGEVTESNVTYIYSDDQTFVPWALWLAVVGVMIAFFGHSLIFTRNTDLTATMACVLAFVAAGLSNMIGYIDIGVAAVGTDVAITPMIKAVHPPWLVYVMVMFALVSVLNIVYQAWRIYLKPKDWSAIYRKRYERY